jgi:hypothetical protein
VVRDDAACELLHDVVADWTTNGPLGVLHEIARRVWLTDVTRYEPDLGDDPLSLGIQASRNLCNLAVAEMSGMPGVAAVDRRTLEVRYGGRVLHTGKAPSEDPAWDVSSLDWSSSEVRDEAARRNTLAYQPLTGTLFEELGPVHGQRVDAAALLNLHFLWQGFPDGTIRSWLGFPRLGQPPWFAVLRLDDADGASGLGLPELTPAGSSPGASFDVLGEPSVPVIRRVTPAAGTGDGTRARGA